MRKTTLFILTIAVSLVFSAQIFGQQYRDIAVVGHNLNNSGSSVLATPNSVFSGWVRGGTASFQITTTNPPLAYLKNKITGAQITCTVMLLIAPTISTFDADVWGGGGDLLFNGGGSFNVSCGTTVLNGTFSRAILHVANGSNSASITLQGNTVTYTAPTNLITNVAGNFAWANGSLSIGMTTEQPIIVNTAGTPSISQFRAYSNIVFGARKI